MQAYQARLDSFSKPKRVKSSSGKASSTSLKWPHPSHFTANPNTLAEAGFYFHPTLEDRDGVQCFMCDKELSDWNSDDDPFEIHWTKCRASCAWAIVRCGLNGDIDHDGNFVFSDPERIPSSRSMEKARLETFVGWPHNSKNHGADPKTMAQAGFVYTPQVAGDDTATCLYCDVSLSGWDDDDDPLKEHRKREKKGSIPCPFLSAEKQPPPPPSSKSKHSAPPSKRSTTTTTKLSSRSRSRSRKPNESEVLTDPSSSSDEFIGPSDIATTAAPRPRKGAGRGKGKSRLPKSAVPGNGGAEEPSVAPSKRATRAASSAAAKAVSGKTDGDDPPVVDDDDRVEPAANNSRHRVEDVGSGDIVRAVVGDVVVKKTKRGKNKAKEPSSDGRVEEVATGSEPLKEVTTLTKKTKKGRSKAKEPSEGQVKDIAAESEPVRGVAAVTKKTKKGRSEKEHVEVKDDPVEHLLQESSGTARLEQEEEMMVGTKKSKSRPGPTREIRELLPKDHGEDERGASNPEAPKKSRRGKKTEARRADRTIDAEPDTLHAIRSAQSTSGVMTKSISGPPSDSESGKARAASASVSGEPGPKSSDFKGPTRTLTADIGVSGGETRSSAPRVARESKTKRVKSKVVVSIDEGAPQPTTIVEPASVPIAPETTPEHPSDTHTKDPISPSASFVPPLAIAPVYKIDSLDERELDMTVEEWIRYEMGKQYEQFKLDGERTINMFKEKASGVRQTIENS